MSLWRRRKRVVMDAAPTPAPFERSCPKTSPIKGPKGWCDFPLTPHNWTDIRTAEEFWCPGYWDEIPAGDVRSR